MHLLANTDNSSGCHTERRKTKRAARKVALIDAFAARVMRGWSPFQRQHNILVYTSMYFTSVFLYFNIDLLFYIFHSFFCMEIRTNLSFLNCHHYSLSMYYIEELSHIILLTKISRAVRFLRSKVYATKCLYGNI
jgi:hypothetical protein